MSDADAHGEETGEVVEGASHDSATLASAFEAAVREDRCDLGSTSWQHICVQL